MRLLLILLAVLCLVLVATLVGSLIVAPVQTIAVVFISFASICVWIANKRGHYDPKNANK